MGSYVLGFQEIDQTQVAVVGGKGAQLGELSRIEGIRVPAGFCVTTDAFRRIMADASSIGDRLDRLSRRAPMTGRRSARSARRSGGSSKGSPSPTILRRQSPARSPGSANKLPTRTDRGRQQRTC